MNSKISFIKPREGSKKIKVEVSEYRREKNDSIRNDYTLLNYPYVRVEVGYQDFIIVKLSYANNYNKPFRIGEEINVFWQEDKLLYWEAYSKGIYKYLPEKWSFIKR